MDHFKNIYESHDHSLRILNIIYGYDTFLDSIEVIADMGCGSGLDMKWWAELETRDDEPRKHNYICYAVDKDPTQIVAELPQNVTVVKGNFEEMIISRKIDLLWSHDSFQYSLNPMQTLANWNKQMNVNGMLVLTVPTYSNHQYNRYVNRAYDFAYFNHNICTLIYMLAVNGFDCRDAYFYKGLNDPWLHAVVYKSMDPLDPTTTKLYDLCDKELLHPSAVNSIQKHGYLRQEDLLYPWIDKDLHYVRD